MNGKKTDRELIEEMWGVLFGNPNHQHGLITTVEKLRQTVANNTKISWAILLIVLGGILKLMLF